jgi:hypothetical protein
VEGRELDGVAVYFADVEVGADGGDVLRRNVVGGAPDLFSGFMLARCQMLKVGMDAIGECARDRLVFPSGLCR